MLSLPIHQIIPSVASLVAHAGHGSSQSIPLLHYISEPQHAWMFAAAIVIVGAIMFSGLLLRETAQD